MVNHNWPKTMPACPHGRWSPTVLARQQIPHPHDIQCLEFCTKLQSFQQTICPSSPVLSLLSSSSAQVSQNEVFCITCDLSLGDARDMLCYHSVTASPWILHKWEGVPQQSNHRGEAPWRLKRNNCKPLLWQSPQRRRKREIANQDLISQKRIDLSSRHGLRWSTLFKTSLFPSEKEARAITFITKKWSAAISCVWAETRPSSSLH